MIINEVISSKRICYKVTSLVSNQFFFFKVEKILFAFSFFYYQKTRSFLMVVKSVKILFMKNMGLTSKCQQQQLVINMTEAILFSFSN